MKDTIKNKLRILAEDSVPGLTVTKAVQAKSKTLNKAANKETEKNIKAFDGAAKKEEKDIVKKFPAEGADKEFHDEMEIRNGQEMVKYDREPNQRFKDRAKASIEGDSTMGNKGGKDMGNAEESWNASDDDFGKNLVKTVKKSNKKRDDGTPTLNQMGDDIEVSNGKSKGSKRPIAVSENNNENNNQTIKEESKMKRLRFKNPFNGIGNALNLIPESYKVDAKVFEMTDNNENYRIRWEGSLTEGKAVVLMASDKKMINEDIEKMKHLFNYKSETTLGTLKGKERVNENESFQNIWNKTKTLLNEEQVFTGVAPKAKEGEWEEAGVAGNDISPEKHNQKLQTKDGTAPAPKAAADLDDAVDYAGEHIPAEAKKKLQTKDGTVPVAPEGLWDEISVPQASDATKHVTLKEEEVEEEVNEEEEDEDEDYLDLKIED